MSPTFEGPHKGLQYSIIDRTGDLYNATIGAGSLVLNTLKTHADLFRAFLTEVDACMDDDKSSVTVTPRSRTVWTATILSPDEMEYDTVQRKVTVTVRYLALSDVMLTRTYPHEVAYCSPWTTL